MGARAAELVAKAEKKLKSFSLKTTLFGSSSKYEDAVELFEKAANAYKGAKQWTEAGDVFQRLSQCHLKLESEHEAAQALVDAAAMYKKVDVPQAMPCLEQAIALYQEAGKLGIAAKHYKDLGEMWEGEQDSAKALEAYEQAADLYDAESQTTTSNNCKLKVATIASLAEQYEKSMDIFQQVALACVDSSTLKYSVKGYLLQAGICALCCQSATALRATLEHYESMDVTFVDSREHKLLEALIAAFEDSDAERYTAAIAEFDSMTRLDNWKTTLLLRAKKRMQALELEEDEGDDLT